MPSPSWKQAKATATPMAVANNKCRPHRCSFSSHRKENSNSFKHLIRSLRSIFLLLLDLHVSSHAAKSWMRRTSTCSINNRDSKRSYSTSTNTGTRSSYLPTSAWRQPRILAKMEACSLRNQFSASLWAFKKVRSKSLTSQNLRRKIKSTSQNKNLIQILKSASKNENQCMCL